MKKNKNIWLNFVAITIILLGAGVGSYAFYTAQRTASENSFTVGTLDLSVTGENNIANEPFIVENIGSASTIEGEKKWKIKNTGTLAGRLLIKMDKLVNLENGCNDQEKNAEPDCDKDNVGELGNAISYKISMDGIDKVNSTLASSQLNTLGKTWNDDVAPIIMQPKEERTITMRWNTPETAYGNEVQSDSVQFNTVFRLIQLINGPTPTN